MGGGGGGYNRPSDSGSGGDSDDSEEEEPIRVPPSESEPEEDTTDDSSDGSNETDSEEAPEDPTSTGGGSGNGGSVAVPEGESEGDNSDSNEETDQQDQTDSEEDTPGDTDSEEKHETDDDEDRDEDDDECLISESTILHSVNPEALETAAEGDICSVTLQEGSICVIDSHGKIVGAIAEPWVGTLKRCIKEGRQYRARILDIEGGKCEVHITNKCLLSQRIELVGVRPETQDQLHRDLSLSVEVTADDVVVVAGDGSHVGTIPGPWASLLSECIDQGQSYKAEVRDIAPEYCVVNIQNDPSGE